MGGGVVIVWVVDTTFGRDSVVTSSVAGVSSVRTRRKDGRVRDGAVLPVVVRCGGPELVVVVVPGGGGGRVNNR